MNSRTWTMNLVVCSYARHKLERIIKSPFWRMLITFHLLSIKSVGINRRMHRASHF